MEAVLALVGGTLLLLSFGGVLFESRILATKEPVPPGDRIAAALVGGALIAVATAVEVGKFSSVLWFGLAVNGAFVVGYATFLHRTRPKKKTPGPPAG